MTTFSCGKTNLDLVLNKEYINVRIIFNIKSMCFQRSVPDGKFCLFLSVSLDRALASTDHFFLSPDFHQLWRSVMSICLLTEVKRQWAILVLGWVTVSVLDQQWDVSQLEFLCH